MIAIILITIFIAALTVSACIAFDSLRREDDNLDRPKDDNLDRPVQSYPPSAFSSNPRRRGLPPHIIASL